MIITSTQEVPGYRAEILGLVFGNTVRAKHLGKDISALLKNVVGGELQEYTAMLSDARQEALNRMTNAANEIGADAVVSVRFTTSQTMAGAAELLAYGTAVKLSPASSK
ncbi:MAG: YbjQ family protein [Methanomicrobiaceae archaeon]|nr:YbjQ family protein [Methanomicrobiaceae archaeon]